MRSYFWALAIVVVGGGLLVNGGLKFMVALKNSAPTKLSFADWVASPPDAEWLELEDVYIDWTASTRIDTERRRRGVKTGTTSEYFVAGWQSEGDEGPVQCFFVVNDAEKKQFMERLWEIEDPVGLPQGSAEVTTVRGLVRTGFDLDSEDEGLLRGLGNVAPEFKIVDLGEEPAAGKGFLYIILGLGAVFGGGLVGFFTYRGKRNAKAQPLYPHPRGPGVPYPPAGVPPQPGVSQQPMPSANYPQQAGPPATNQQAMPPGNALPPPRSPPRPTTRPINRPPVKLPQPRPPQGPTA